MRKRVFCITKPGELRFLASTEDLTEGSVSSLVREGSHQRLSRVKPCLDGWIVVSLDESQRLLPEVFYTRDQAIAAEVQFYTPQLPYI